MDEGRRREDEDIEEREGREWQAKKARLEAVSMGTKPALHELPGLFSSTIECSLTSSPNFIENSNDDQKLLELSLGPSQLPRSLTIEVKTVENSNDDQKLLELSLGPSQLPRSLTVEVEKLEHGKCLELPLVASQQQRSPTTEDDDDKRTELPLFPTSPQHQPTSNQGPPPDVVGPPFPWATMAPATVKPISLLRADGIFSIRGEAVCQICKHCEIISLDLMQKYGEVNEEARGITDRKASRRWMSPTPRNCRNCGISSVVWPALSKEPDKINWLFLFLDQGLEKCNLEQLKWYLKHNRYPCSGNKDVRVYNSYVAIGKQLDPAFGV